MPKRSRLSRREFTHLLKRGARVHRESLTIIHLKTDEFKAGVVVSKKTARKAVTRNLLRRRVYAILRELQPGIGPRHIAVLLRPAATRLSYADLRDQLQALRTQ